MKIDVDQHNNLRLREVYSGVLLETSEGNRIGICMRDDTLEINVLPKGKDTQNWWHVNMQEGTIEKEPTSDTVCPTETAESVIEESEDNSDELWKCPVCGNTETWFDRSVSFYPDGTEEGPTTRCAGCGRDVDEAVIEETS